MCQRCGDGLYVSRHLRGLKSGAGSASMLASINRTRNISNSFANGTELGCTQG